MVAYLLFYSNRCKYSRNFIKKLENCPQLNFNFKKICVDKNSVGIIRNEVNNMILIKSKFKGDDAKIYEECANESNFLFTYYTDIFNKVRKDEIDIGILNKFIDVLRRIEDEELDQHEGSFLVGTLLKELYVDSAIKKADKLNELYANDNTKLEPKKPEVKVSWSQWKKMNV
jgi:hypothetical protein